MNGDPNMQQPGFPFFGGGPEPGPPTGNVPSSSSAGGVLPGATGGGASTSSGAGQFINSPHQSLSSSGLDQLVGPSSVNATANFSPRPISSVENKQDMKQTISKLLSPTSSGFSPSNSQNQASSDPLFQAGGLPSLSSIKNEPLTSPTFGGGGPTSIPNPPQSQSIKTELNSVGGSGAGDMSSALNVPEMPPLPESIPSVPNTHTPAPGKRQTNRKPFY